MGLLIPYLKSWKGWLFLEAVLKVAGTLSELSLPFFLARMIDRAIPAGDFLLARRLGAIMLAVTFLACILHLITNRMSVWIAADIGHRMRRDEISVIFQSDELVLERQSAELISRVTTDTYTITDSLGLLQRGGMRIPLTVAGSACIMLYLDSPLALGMLAGIALAILAAARKVILGTQRYEMAGRGGDRMLRTVREDYDGIGVIRSFRAEDREIRRYMNTTEAAYADMTEADILMAAVRPSMQAWLYTSMIVLLFVGAWQIASGQIAAGTLVAFMSYVTMLQGALTNLMRILVNVTKMRAALNRVAEVMDAKGIRDCSEPGQEHESKGYEKIIPDPEEPEYVHRLAAECLSYLYPDGTAALQDISFDVCTGEVLCVVGGPESGKSTLLDILMGFLTPSSGQVLFDGKNLPGVSFGNRQKIISAAFQNERLLCGTVKKNLVFWRESLSDRDLRHAVRAAQAEEFLKERAGVWQTPVEHEGRNFSGGQRQRLRLARALADRTPVLLLDDSLSALDHLTVRKILENLRMRKDQIIILTTQQAELAEFADRVLLLDGGKQGGYGTCKALMRNCPTFRELTAAQEEVPESI